MIDALDYQNAKEANLLREAAIGFQPAEEHAETAAEYRERLLVSLQTLVNGCENVTAHVTARAAFLIVASTKPNGDVACTGHINDLGHLSHDGDTCSIHEGI